jgi:kynurenine formamidase
MKLIDLSRELYHRTPTLPNHPPVVMTEFGTHADVRRDGDVTFSSRTMVLTLGDHSGTHVDAPSHFDARPGAPTVDELPLENFYTEAVCLDLSPIPLKTDVRVEDLEQAEARAGVTIKPRDTVFLYMAVHERLFGTPGYLIDFPGLTKESAEWLGRKGIVSFGVEAPSPGRPGRNNFLVHLVCRDLGFTHMECLCNLDKLVGQGRFRFIGFPLRIKGGSGSPIRAVAVLDDERSRP